MDRDKIAQLVEETRQGRIDAGVDLTDAQERVNEATKALTSARRAYAAAWDQAIDAGWTSRELRELKLAAPPDNYRPRTRTRRPRAQNSSPEHSD